MSKGFYCDICDRRFPEYKLHHFQESYSYYSVISGSKKSTKNFDMCEECKDRIIREIKKEGTEQ